MRINNRALGKKESLKKAVAYLLAMMIILLAGCGTSAPSVRPTQPPEATEAEATATPAKTAEPEETLVRPDPVDPQKVFYFRNALEASRIYRQGLDGSGLTLICDVEAEEIKEMGGYLYFVNRDRALCRCPADGGDPEILFSEYPIWDLCSAGESVLVFACYKEDEKNHEAETILYRHDVTENRTEKIVGGLWGSEIFTTDNHVLYTVSNPETGDMEYRCLNLETGESVPCPKTDEQTKIVFTCENEVYEYDLGGVGGWTRLDPASMQREKIELEATIFDRVCGFDGTDFLMCSELEPACLYRVSGTDRTLVHEFQSEGITCIDAVAQKGDTVIISVVDYLETSVFDENDYGYSLWNYYAVSMATGQITRITAPGEAGQLFAEGKFPQMDVSTARKPLASVICDLFFRQYGKKGTEPMNHKSHGAWLNLADKGCDLILVPAPTEEEKAYLAEKNVKVDMKAFGADGLVFISGTGSGVTNLSMEQLKAIYRGEITNWKELGGVDHAITVFYRNDQSGSQRQFEKLVWRDEEVPDFDALNFQIMDDMVTIVEECQNDPYAIGYSIMTYLYDVFGNRDVCLMGIDGVAPTLETVTDNSYSLTLQDWVVIRADEEENSPARRLYDWFGSPQCDDILRQVGLTPIHPRV